MIPDYTEKYLLAEKKYHEAKFVAARFLQRISLVGD
jgi:hypothetical protein